MNVKGFILCILLAASSLLLLSPAEAATTTWIGGTGGDGNWSEEENWDSGVPGPWDDAYFTSNGAVTVDTDTAVLGGLNIDISGSGIMTVEHTANTLTLGDGASLIINSIGDDPAVYILGGNGVLVKTNYEVKIGTDGSGEFYQDGGIFEFSGAMYLGDYGYGVYRMDGGSITAGPTGKGGVVLGEWEGTGEFYQSDGSVDIYDLTLGRQDEGSGNYELTGGSLSVENQVVVGGGGSGLFIQDGGSHTAGSLTVGSYHDSTLGNGEYWLVGGELTVESDLVIGNGGVGWFDQEGGIVSVTDNLVLGRMDDDFNSGEGYYESISPENLLSIGGYASIGESGWGDFYQYAGNVSITGGYEIWQTPYNPEWNEYAGLVIGKKSAGTGQYTLMDGTLTVDNVTIVGGQGSGTFNLGDTGGGDAGGALAASEAIHDTGALYVGYQNGENLATYNLYDGILSVRGFTVIGGKDYLADAGTGLFRQEGGIHETSGLFIADNASSKGMYDLLGGELHVGTWYTIGGNGGEGHFYQSGGQQYTDGDMNITETGEFTMDGGDLDVGANLVNQGIFTLNGGSVAVTGKIINNKEFYNTSGDLLFDIFTGSGTVYDHLENPAIVSPGNSPGTMTIEGNYLQTPDGLLYIELGGTDQGETYDLLSITGGAWLDGYLEVVLWEDFALSAGDEFDILVTDILFGEFNTLILPTGWNWDIAYLDLDSSGDLDTVRLTANAVPVPATVLLLGFGLACLIGIRRRSEIT